METVIRFYSKNVYGETRIYPVDYAVEIETMCQTKTITPRIKKGLEGMGFKFVEVLESSINQKGAIS